MYSLTFIHDRRLYTITTPSLPTALILRTLVPMSRIWVHKTQLYKG